MAVPSSGEISLGKIRQELQAANYTSGPYTAAATALDLAENGSYATINTCSPYYPLSANPANMSEWYGYDHDAPCPYCTASYYFNPPDNDYLKSGDVLQSDPYANLQADLQESFTVSMWVQPYRIDEPTVGDPGYQRIHGLCYWQDLDNGYYISIEYIPFYVNGSTNYLAFTVANASGSTNFRSWLYDLDNTNAAKTGIDPNKTWSDENKGNVNSNFFAHLVFVYDVNASSAPEQVKMYWNAEELQDVNYTNNGGPTGLTWDNSTFVLGQGAVGGLSSGAAGIWYGWIGWFSYLNRYPATQTDVDTLYNSGSPLVQGDVTGIGPGMFLWEFGEYPTSNLTYDFNTGTIDLYVNNQDKWTNSIYP